MALSGIVIVTGAAALRSLGRAVALRAASLGADVVVSDIDRPAGLVAPNEAEADWRGLDSVVAEIEALGRRATAVTCDITRRQQIEALVATAEQLGPVTGLVNAARAVQTPKRPVVDFDEAVWDRTLTTNVRGTMSFSAVVARSMLAAGTAGSIVNISSKGGLRPTPGSAAYCASKAAINMLTRVMALELASSGIRVNAVCSGEIATNRFFPEELTWAQEQGMEWAAYRQRFIELTGKRMPLGRIAEPEDIAAAAGYLLSPASSYITGEIMDLTGASRWVDTSVTV